MVCWVLGWAESICANKKLRGAVVSRPGLILGYAGAIPGFTPLAPLRNYANTKWLSSALVRADEALVRPGPEAPSSARTRLWSGRTRLWSAPDQSSLVRPDLALVRAGEATLLLLECGNKMVCWVLGWAEGICANMKLRGAVGHMTRTYPGLRWCNTRIYAIGPVVPNIRNYANTMCLWSARTRFSSAPDGADEALVRADDATLLPPELVSWWLPEY